MPGNLSFFRGTDGQVEHTTRVNAPLLLKWTDHLTKDGLDRFSTRFKFFDENDLPGSIELE